MRRIIAVAATVLLTGHAAADGGLHLSDHPLVDRIVRTSDDAEVSRAELEGVLSEADFVVLGEKHDNARHHVIQAELVEHLGTAGRLDVVAFEMFPRDLQMPITLHFQQAGDAAGLADAIEWDQLGWGSWAWYGPIVHAAIRHDATIVAADLSRQDVRAVYEGGFRLLDAGFVERTGLSVPLAADDQTVREAAMVAAHCGHAPGDAAASMVAVQRARDAMLADQLVRLTGGGQGVLITGNGHADTTIAVPPVLARLAPDATVVSLGLVEVEPSRTALDADDAPYDFVWFTPRAKPIDFDYCDQFRQSRG